MGIFGKFKNLMGMDEDEEEYEDEYYEDEEEEEEVPAKKSVKADFNVSKPVTSSGTERSISFGGANPQLEVVLVKPENFEDASGIADSLNAKKTVVLNLENTSKEIARRLVDFLSGVAYANSGRIKKIANSTFIIIPHNVDISGIGILDEMDTSSSNLY